MSRMLVAYEKCGCRAMALLDADEDPSAEATFRADAMNEGLAVREEHRSRIGARRCGAHGGNDMLTCANCDHEYTDARGACPKCGTPEGA